MTLSTIFNKIKSIFTKAKSVIDTLKVKALTFITANKTVIQGFIKVVSYLYENCEGEEKMEKVIKLVTASITGTEYTDEQAEELRETIEEKVQEIYNEMKENGLV